MDPLHSNSTLLQVQELLKELLQELYIILLDIELLEEVSDELNIVLDNLLLEYDLDPKNVLEIMTSNSQNNFCYSSLIRFFYQRGIGCEVDEIKASEIFSNAVKNNRKEELNQFSLDQQNESIATFCNDNHIKKLNKVILQYFYSLFLYKEFILCRKYNYKLHIKNAEKGDNVSQHFIGECYYCGKNFKQDYNKAVEWYSRSSKGGNFKAIYKLGCCYDFGYGVKEDENKAFELYLKSAEGGYKEAFKDVGDCYYDGRGISKDENEAIEWYLKGAEKGDIYCQYLVANYYNYGKHVPKNEEKWFYWIRKAAIHGDIKAQYKLAEYYLNNSINKNESKAFRWSLKLPIRVKKEQFT